MWILFAFGSALFAGITAVLAKTGIKNTDSDMATAVRTIVVLAFSWLMVFITGSQATLSQVSLRSLVFLILSGLATGASWLFYFKAIQLGDVNKVAPIDKSSTVLTMLLAVVLLGEAASAVKFAGAVAIGVGTLLMIAKKPEKKEEKAPSSRLWMLCAFLSAIFASLTSILGKVGIQGIESNLGTAIRTIVVLIMAWLVVFIKNRGGTWQLLRRIDRRSMLFICLSGVATGASWLCYYRALSTGEASVVVPIDKLSILPTVAFAYIFLKEKLSARALCGLLLITSGTLLLLAGA